MIWQSTDLNDPAFIILNGLWSGKKAPYSKAKVLRNTNFRNDGRLSFDDVAELDVEEKALSQKKLVSGDILIERSGGGPKQPVGRVCIFERNDSPNFSFSNFTSTLRIIDRKKFLPLFVCYYLLHLYRQGVTENLQRATTGIRNLDFTAYRKLRIPIPPLKEQIRISEVLYMIQATTDIEVNLIGALQELKSAVMQQLFTRGLRLETQTETEIGLVPESWEVKTLGSFSTIKSGGTPSRSNEEYWLNGNIPWVKTGEVDFCEIDSTEEKITKTGLDNSAAKLFPTGTLLMAMYGQGITRGKVALLSIDAATNQACAAIFPDSTTSSRYLFHYLTYKYDYLRTLGHGANQKNLNTDIIREVACAIPPTTEEQEEICLRLDLLNQAILIQEKKIHHLEELFGATLAKLMSAEVRVNDLNIKIDTFHIQSMGAAA